MVTVGLLAVAALALVDSAGAILTAAGGILVVVVASYAWQQIRR